MFIESPVEVVPEVTTDEALNQLYSLRQLAEEGRWCRGLHRPAQGPVKEKYCVLGWMSIFAGWDGYEGKEPFSGNLQSQAWNALHRVLPPEGRHKSSPAYNDRVIFEGYIFHKDRALEWVDKAIEYRKKQL